MKFGLKKFNIRQAGITLVELAISMAIVGVMGTAVVLVVGRTFQENSHSSEQMKAIEQVENAGYWINHDALMAQNVETGGGSFLELSWQTLDGTINRVTYALSGNTLQRTYSVINGTTVLSTVNSMVAQNINLSMTSCSYNDGVLTFQVTSTVGTINESRNYQVETRMDQAAS